MHESTRANIAGDWPTLGGGNAWRNGGYHGG